MRLYRVEIPPEHRTPGPEWVRQMQNESGHTEAMDRWFTADPHLLEWYRQDATAPTRTVYVDLPERVAEQFRVTNQDHLTRRFSRDPENEFFVPRSVADQRRELKPQESVMADPVAKKEHRHARDEALEKIGQWWQGQINDGRVMRQARAEMQMGERPAQQQENTRPRPPRQPQPAS